MEIINIDNDFITDLLLALFLKMYLRYFMRIFLWNFSLVRHKFYKMFLCSPNLVFYTVSKNSRLVSEKEYNIFVKMCFIRREMRHKYKAYYLPTLQCLWRWVRKFNLICRSALINNKLKNGTSPTQGRLKDLGGTGKPKQLITIINELII